MPAQTHIILKCIHNTYFCVMTGRIYISFAFQIYSGTMVVTSIGCVYVIIASYIMYGYAGKNAMYSISTVYVQYIFQFSIMYIIHMKF